MEIDKTNLDNYITGNYGEDEQKLHKNMLFNLKEIKEAIDLAFGDDGLRGNEVVDLLKQMKEGDNMQPKRIINSMKVKVIEEDLLKVFDKIDDLEQMIYNQGAKNRDNYKLVNDRITEAFDIIKILERKE